MERISNVKHRIYEKRKLDPRGRRIEKEPKKLKLYNKSEHRIKISETKEQTFDRRVKKIEEKPKTVKLCDLKTKKRVSETEQRQPYKNCKIFEYKTNKKGKEFEYTKKNQPKKN